MHVYQSHLGGIYATDEYFNDLYCETCGDSDWYIGDYGSAIKFLKDFADSIDAEDGYGGYSIGHVLEQLAKLSDCPDKERAIELVKEHRCCEDQY